MERSTITIPRFEEERAAIIICRIMDARLQINNNLNYKEESDHLFRIYRMSHKLRPLEQELQFWEGILSMHKLTQRNRWELNNPWKALVIGVLSILTLVAVAAGFIIVISPNGG